MGKLDTEPEKSRYAALETAFLVYEFGFEHLGFGKSHFDVMKGNKGMIKFRQRTGTVQIDEDEQNLYFEISKAAVQIPNRN